VLRQAVAKALQTAVDDLEQDEDDERTLLTFPKP
jgi:hypothetical protein